jgi:Flp pilus assembly pilin Flp
MPAESNNDRERTAFLSKRDKPTRTMFEYAFIVTVTSVAIVVGIGAVNIAMVKTFNTISLALE